MRGLGLFLGSNRRNDPVRLENPRPDPRPERLDTGDAGLDGYSVLSRANANAQGNPPPVKGVVGPVYWGPDMSFEQ
jgi:hypothetical protein